MIYTVTCNPSLDYVMVVKQFEEGETNRSSKEEMYAGGKGFNVSTILSRLGVENTALGFLAGFTGAEIKRQLETRGFHLALCELAEGFSRVNVKMKGKAETEINGNGPCIPQEKVEELFSLLAKLENGDTLILAGSIPSSLPDDLYEKMMQAVAGKGIRVVVDATKDLLKKVLPYKPFLIKPNHRELEELFQVSIQTKEDLILYASKLQEEGAVNVLVSLGKDGAFLLSEEGHVYYCKGAKGTLVNSVGSGDSMVAGFMAGYVKEKDYANALLLGSACGGATAFSEDLAQLDTIMEVAKTLQVEMWK